MQAVGASQRVFQLLDRLAEMQPCGQEVPRGRPEGADLNLRSVSFAYPSRPEIQVQSSLINIRLPLSNLDAAKRTRCTELCRKRPFRAGSVAVPQHCQLRSCKLTPV